ncbi:hypothetical protein K505DRAFT_323804 [Melanomma pulvis-pyrius CBS 109.77]|uniref:Uncharacterized protein n=1 Tax=Melanomma pulvis-pyrius CBS 109.77 TaxID=1314802 RepID=A0A6A6XHV0_9PLEO|nr:hypothetical protein K505DRAFT_323804 [Melanomma pulvis-pyrius CBS 109.77]
MKICTNFSRETTFPEDCPSFGEDERNSFRLVESLEKIVGFYGILVTGTVVKTLGIISLESDHLDDETK